MPNPVHHVLILTLLANAIVWCVIWLAWIIHKNERHFLGGGILVIIGTAGLIIMSEINHFIDPAYCSIEATSFLVSTQGMILVAIGFIKELKRAMNKFRPQS